MTQETEKRPAVRLSQEAIDGILERVREAYEEGTHNGEKLHCEFDQDFEDDTYVYGEIVFGFCHLTAPDCGWDDWESEEPYDIEWIDDECWHSHICEADAVRCDIENWEEIFKAVKRVFGL